MPAIPEDAWADRVSRVFNPRPRIADESDPRWIPRAEEAKLRRSLASDGAHTCLYGPSGSGKTSLVRTVIARMGNRGKNHIYVRINSGTNWHSFKSQIIENKSAKIDIDSVSGIKLSVQNFVPSIELNAGLHRQALGNARDRSNIVDAITLTLLAQVLASKNVVLVVDDVNFATDDLLKTLTDLAKELTDFPDENRSKIVFVGADDIYLRINELQPNLKERVDEVALGSIDDPESTRAQPKRSVVWKFLCDGLEQLGLQRPDADRHVSKEAISACQLSIEHAADGLPKSIIKLGRTIAEKGFGRSRVSVTDIQDAAHDMIRRNFQYYRASYRTLIEHLRRTPLLPEICQWMFSKGASRIYEVDQLAEDFRSKCTYFVLEGLLLELVEKKLITLTGRGGTVFFAKDPLLAHTLGVAVSNPALCGIDAEYFGSDTTTKQLFLAFTGNRDPENRPTL